MSEVDLKKGMSVIKQTIKNISNTPGIYKMINHNQEILYIGKAKDLVNRLPHYVNISNLPNRLKKMVSMIKKIEILTTSNEVDALLLESSLIKQYKPRFNIALKDDKSFPYISINENHDFPRIMKYRGEKKEGVVYYGPFPDAKKINLTLTELQKIFLIRICSDNYFASRTRPCLQYQIKRCSAPCVGKITKEQYKNDVNQLRNFLSDKKTDIRKKLISEMETASQQLNFEKAAQIRDKIQLINYIQSKSMMKRLNVEQVDIFAIYKEDTISKCCIQVFFIRNGYNCGNKAYFFKNLEFKSNEEVLSSFILQFYRNAMMSKEIWINETFKDLKIFSDALNKISKLKCRVVSPKKGNKLDIIKFATENAKVALERNQKESIKNLKILKNLKKEFELKNIPKRIEIYDNSHISGQYAVGCVIVAGEEGFFKSRYRKYKITTKSYEGGDDYSMLQEVLTRRYKKLAHDNHPDLIIIDGGKGQLSAALNVFEKLSISHIIVVAISKGIHRNAGREFFHIKGKSSFQMPKNSELLYYLQTLRDEAHRFAITTHRKLRLKSLTKSTIDLIPGISTQRKKLLLNHFGSLDKLKSVSVDEIKKINGIGKIFAKKIYDYFH